MVVPGENVPRAGIPILDVGGGIRRKRYITLPFTDFCPPLVRSADVAVLSDALASAHVSGQIPRLELRADVPLPGGTSLSAGVIHRLAIDPDPARLYAAFHKSQVQRAIVRAEREGLSVRRAERMRDLTEDFYALHLQTRHRLGAPIQPRRYFRLLWERLIEPGLGFVLLVTVRNRVVAGAVFLAWNRTAIYKYGASDRAALPMRPNHALFWNAIQWAAENGYHTLDFGRSDSWNTGLRSFKSGWGAAEEDLNYTYLGFSRPSSGASQRRLIEPLLKRSPAFVTRVVGELLYRYAA